MKTWRLQSWLKDPYLPDKLFNMYGELISHKSLIRYRRNDRMIAKHKKREESAFPWLRDEKVPASRNIMAYRAVHLFKRKL